MAGFHHIEVWIVDLEEARREWGWLLEAVGLVRTARWADGESWGEPGGSGAYLTLTTSPNLGDPVHDRRRPGVNHVALWGGAPADLDALVVAAPAHGWTPLYADRYPHAGGPDHYAAWFENAAGFKVEVVAVVPDAA